MSPVPESLEFEPEELTRGPLHEAFAEVTSEPEPGLVVTDAPPEPLDEIPPSHRPEGEDVVWIPGYWGWDEDAEEFIWISGVWRRVPPNRTWVPGYWQEVEGGHQWVSGFWTVPDGGDIEYLPTPPATAETGPSSEPPSDRHFYVPGCWLRVEQDYRWRPGFWAALYDDWTWIPHRYVWTPRGCIFRRGYWDYLPPRRGVLFAPIRCGVPLVTVHRYRYTPSCVIDVGPSLLVHLFIRPRYCHYYFGDYYAARYRHHHIYPWVNAWHQHRHYDPLFAYYYYHPGQRHSVLHRAQGWHRHFERHQELRPPHRFADQQLRRNLGDVTRISSLGRHFQHEIERTGGGHRFVRLDEQSRARIRDRLEPLRALERERAQIESPRGGPAARDNMGVRARLGIRDLVSRDQPADSSDIRSRLGDASDANERPEAAAIRNGSAATAGGRGTALRRALREGALSDTADRAPGRAAESDSQRRAVRDRLVEQLRGSRSRQSESPGTPSARRGLRGAIGQEQAASSEPARSAAEEMIQRYRDRAERDRTQPSTRPPSRLRSLSNDSSQLDAAERLRRQQEIRRQLFDQRARRTDGSSSGLDGNTNPSRANTPRTLARELQRQRDRYQSQPPARSSMTDPQGLRSRSNSAQNRAAQMLRMQQEAQRARERAARQPSPAVSGNRATAPRETTRSPAVTRPPLQLRSRAVTPQPGQAGATRRPPAARSEAARPRPNSLPPGALRGRGAVRSNLNSRPPAARVPRPSPSPRAGAPAARGQTRPSPAINSPPRARGSIGARSGIAPRASGSAPGPGSRRPLRKR